MRLRGRMGISAVVATMGVVGVLGFGALSPSASAQPGSRVCGVVFANEATGSYDVRFVELPNAFSTYLRTECKRVLDVKANPGWTKTTIAYDKVTCESFSKSMRWAQLSTVLRDQLRIEGKTYDPNDVCRTTARDEIQNIWYSRASEGAVKAIDAIKLAG